MLQSADGGSSDCHNAPGTAKGLIDGGGCFRGDRVLFYVDLVIFDTLDANRLKSPEPNVESDLGGFYFTFLDTAQNLGSEM